MQAFYDKRRDAHLCVKCGKDAKENRKHCQDCLDKARVASKEARLDRISRGLCPNCAHLPTSDEHRFHCSGRAKEIRDTRRSAGLCTECGGAKGEGSGKNVCALCLSQQRAKRAEEKLTVLAAYGRMCVCCGEDEVDFLQVDHIDGGGHAHRQKIGRDICSWLIANKFPAGFQILCANCNTGKRLNSGICPKHKKRLGSQ